MLLCRSVADFLMATLDLTSDVLHWLSKNFCDFTFGFCQKLLRLKRFGRRVLFKKNDRVIDFFCKKSPGTEQIQEEGGQLQSPWILTSVAQVPIKSCPHHWVPVSGVPFWPSLHAALRSKKAKMQRKNGI